MDEPISIEALRATIDKQSRAFIESQRKLIRTINVALLALAAVAAVNFLVWLL